MAPSQQIPLDQLLTAQQKAYAHEYAPTFAREQIAAMLSTAPIDEEAVKPLLCDIYRMAKLASPPIRWFDSPVSFVQEALRVSLGAHREDPSYLSTVEERRYVLNGQSYDTSPWNTVRQNVFSALSPVEKDLRAQVWQNVEHRLENIWVHVREYIRRRRERDTTWGGMWWDMRVGTYVSLSLEAYQRASTLAGIRFLYEVLETDPCRNLVRFNELGQLVSGYWLGKKEAWLVRKPVLLERDEQGRWHNASGPCILYRDGWGWYAWHGVTVPEQIILHPERLTKWDWIGQRNVEVRRAIQERLGNERFIEMVGGKQIDTGRRGKLIEIKLGRRDPERVARFVQVQDTSTKRQYYLRVPPLINSADKAIAWTFGLTEEEYQPQQET
jgi:hypothetical protein